MVPGFPKFKVIDVPFERGSTPPILAATNFYSKLPLISRIYPMISEDRRWREVCPFFVKMINGMSMVPLNEKIEKDDGRWFLVSKCNDTVGTWRLEIPEKFLTAGNLGKENLLFVVENGVQTIKEGENAWSSILDKHNDMRFRGIPGRPSVKVSTMGYPEIFKGFTDDLAVTLHIGYKVKGYESFVNIASVGGPSIHSTTNTHRNLDLNPNMTIAHGVIELVD